MFRGNSYQVLFEANKLLIPIASFDNGLTSDVMRAAGHADTEAPSGSASAAGPPMATRTIMAQAPMQPPMAARGSLPAKATMPAPPAKAAMPVLPTPWSKAAMPRPTPAPTAPPNQLAAMMAQMTQMMAQMQQMQQMPFATPPTVRDAEQPPQHEGGDGSGARTVAESGAGAVAESGPSGAGGSGEVTPPVSDQGSAVGECLICKSPLFSSGPDNEALPCGHVYHAQCIQRWRDTKSLAWENCCALKCRANNPQIAVIEHTLAPAPLVEEVIERSPVPEETEPAPEPAVLEPAPAVLEETLVTVADEETQAAASATSAPVAEMHTTQANVNAFFER